MSELASLNPRRILVCQLRQIGDVILATPALELLKRRFPEAELHMVTEKKCAPVLYGNPRIDVLWELDKTELSSLKRELAWYWKVARQGFDLVIDFQQLPRCRWIVGFSRAPVRLSFFAPWYNRLLYTDMVPLRHGYSAFQKANLLAPLGIECHDEPPRIYLSEAERHEIRQDLAQLGLVPGQPLVTLGVTHKDNARRWPAAHYAQLAEGLLAAEPGLAFLPLWGPGEEKTVEALLAAMSPAVRAATRIMRHEPTLRRMAACIAEASLHIGNCSAPRHMAVAVGTPSCTVLGASNDTWTYPSSWHQSVRLGLSCQPCRGDNCRENFRCLRELQPAAVLDTALGLLRKRLASTSGIAPCHLA